MQEQILRTKLFIPPLRPGIVSRPRLLQKMTQGMEAGAHATLITAPAGYGKSTLALEWLESLGMPQGWISLDRGDNHLAQFLAYLTAAIEQVASNGPAQLHPPLDLGNEAEGDGLHARLMDLINKIASLESSFVLVLDDYHLITDLSIHQAVGFLIEHQPPQMHLVIATRQDPLLPLSKLRSRGWTTEVRLGELRFTPEETTRFLNDTMRLDLLPEQIAALETRTEGWIAGLQLAALSLAELPEWADVSRGIGRPLIDIQAFAADDRHIVDYLTDEVLSRQPEEIQQFLLQTSILKRLCGPLCEAVMGDPFAVSGESPVHLTLPMTMQPVSSQSSGSKCQLILEYLEHANLFIIPQDNRRQWYRYHHLFAELLNNRLQAAHADIVSELHCRASEWYENNRMYTDAVDHALLAEDFDRALRLIENSASSSIWASGDLPVLLNWSRRLPDNVFMTRPRLCLYYARGLFFAGQVDAAERHIQQAENALRNRTGKERTTEELWGVLYTNQATVRAMRGEGEAALMLAGMAKEKVSPEDISTQARILHAVGTAEFLRGDVQRAEDAFSRGAKLASQVRNLNLGLDLLSCLALSHILAGRLSAAASVCEETLAEIENRKAPAASSIFLAFAQVQLARNELDEVRSTLETCIDMGIKAGWPHVLWQAYLLQAELKQAIGDTSWVESLRLAQELLKRYPLPRPNRMVRACQARLELAGGNNEVAARWAKEYLRQVDYQGLRDYEELAVVRILFSQGNSADALERLGNLESFTRSAGRIASLIEALVVRAKILKAAGDQDAALQSLSAAVKLAEPEGFVRAFLSEGEEIAALIVSLQKTKLPANVFRFLSKILAQFGEGGLLQVQESSKALSTNSLVEPLSPREMEVLGLVAEGLSNAEIAARLFLSVNTLRAHTTNIYQKLDVHSRMQAVTRARELGLLA